MILASSLQSWNRNTNRDNMQEKPLVYVRLSLQVEYYWKPINKLKLCLIFLNSAKSKNLQNLDWSIQKDFDQAGLFLWRHPTLGLQLGSVGRDFFYFGEGQSRYQGLTAFLIETWSQEKEPLSATIVIIDSDKALFNERNERIRFN